MDVNLIELFKQYKGDDNECRKVLEALRWPEGKKCPRCGSSKTSRAMKEGHNYNCDVCHYQFTVTAGTIFHDSHLSLWTWFLAVYLMCESKKGMSANQLKRTLGVSYKTAWYLCHRIRKAMAEVYENEPKLNGIVEVDETYVGGKYDKRRKRGRHGKSKPLWVFFREKEPSNLARSRQPARKFSSGVIKERINKTREL